MRRTRLRCARVQLLYRRVSRKDFVGKTWVSHGTQGDDGSSSGVLLSTVHGVSLAICADVRGVLLYCVRIPPTNAGES